MIKHIFKSALVLIGVILFSGISKVAVGQDFEVAPVKLEFDAEPSLSQTKTLNVKNHSNKKVSYTIVIADFLPSSSGEQRFLPPNSTKRSCANWLNINPTFFELNPNDEILVQVSMLVPGEEYSSAWCMLFVQPSIEQTSWNADKTMGAGVRVTGRIGVQIQQSPKSNINKKIQISNFIEVSSKSDQSRFFTATIENVGDKVTKCKVFLMASNMITAEEKKFPPKEYEIYPKMSRNIELELPNDLAPGTYALAAIVDYGPKHPLEGAQIVIEVKGNNRTITPDTTKVE